MILHFISTFFIFIGCLFSLFVFIEFAVFLTLRLFNPQKATRELTGNALMNPLFETADSFTEGAEWRKDYLQDIQNIFQFSNNTLNTWQPLGLWAATQYQGKCVNIEQDNLRKTIQSHDQFFHDPISTCHFYGGSLVWGWSVRDEKTIPSLYASITKNTYVENHAQLGFVSTQSFFALIQSLKHKIPDSIVFLEGLNDIYSAYQSGVAGIEQNAISRKTKYEQKIPKNLFDALRSKCALSMLLQLSKNKNSTARNLMTPEYDEEKLAIDIITSYNHNMRMIDAISSAYGIKTYLIWPPTIFDKPNLTQYEATVFNLFSALHPLYKTVKEMMKLNHPLYHRVHDLSDLFKNEMNPVFIDPWHYNEYANWCIAAKISELTKVGISSMSTI